MKCYLFILQLILLSNLHAQDLWNYIDGPIGENPNVVSTDGENYILAGTDHGLFESTDGGENWDYVGLGNIEIISLQALTYGNYLVGTNAGLYKYKQIDKTHELVILTDIYGNRFLRIYRIQILENIIYIFTDLGLYYSFDSTETWNANENFTYSLKDITITESGLFIAPDWEGHLFRSQDHGVTWDTLTNTFSSFQHLTSTANGYLFASTIYSDDYTTINSYVLRSIDNGESWERVLPPTSVNLNKLSWEIRIYPVNLFSDVEDNLYFAKNDYNNYSGCNLVKSSDYGETWEETQLSGSLINYVSLANGVLYASTSCGIFSSLNEGYSFDLISSGIGSANLTSLEITETGSYYVGTPSGLYSTENNGITWKMIGFEGKYIHEVIANNNGTIFCSLAYSGPESKELFRSKDYGNHWEEVKIDLFSYCLDIEKGSHGEVYVFKSDHLYVSYNDGDSWQSIFGSDFQFDFQYSQIGNYADNLVFFCLENSPEELVSKTYYSTDSGTTWGEIYFENHPFTYYSFSLSNNNILYAFKNRFGFFRTDDWGQTWVNLPLQLENYFECIDEIRAKDSRVVVYKSFRVHYSNDYGITWSTISNGSDLFLLNAFRFFDNSIYCIGNHQIAYADLTVIDEIAGNAMPSDCKLEQNYPNPFNSETRIEYFINKPSFVSLKIYNILGEEICVLENQYKLPGSYKIPFSASRIPSGVYFYRLNAGKLSMTKKMLLIR